MIDYLEYGFASIRDYATIYGKNLSFQDFVIGVYNDEDDEEVIKDLKEHYNIGNGKELYQYIMENYDERGKKMVKEKLDDNLTLKEKA